MSLEKANGVWPERLCLFVKCVCVLAVFASRWCSVIALLILLQRFDTAAEKL